MRSKPISYTTNLWILPLLMAIFSVSLQAQKPGKDSWDNLNRLQAGQKIEVVQMDMKSLKGRFLGFSEEGISVRVKKDEVTVLHADVLRVTLRENPKRLRNVLTLAGVGTGVGLGLGIAALGATGGSDSPGVVMNPAMALGAGLGGALGAATPSYETIYRVKRKKARQSSVQNDNPETGLQRNFSP